MKNSVDQSNGESVLPQVAELLDTQALAGSASFAYQAVKQTEESDAASKTQSADFRYVPHGHGPCSCCGPYSE